MVLSCIHGVIIRPKVPGTARLTAPGVDSVQSGHLGDPAFPAPRTDS